MADLLIYPEQGGWVFGLVLEYDEERNPTMFVDARGELHRGALKGARVARRDDMDVEPFHLLLTLPTSPVTLEEARELVRPYMRT